MLQVQSEGYDVHGQCPTDCTCKQPEVLRIGKTNRGGNSTEGEIASSGNHKILVMQSRSHQKSYKYTLSVICLSVCEQPSSYTTLPIVTKLTQRCKNDEFSKLLNFGDPSQRSKAPKTYENIHYHQHVVQI